MRNYNDNKIVLTSGSDVAQMLRAYSLTPDVPVMAVKPEEPHHHQIAAPRRARPVEIEILRNGKSSESVSFVNEAAANGGGTKNSAGHARKAAAQFDNDDADAGAAGASSTAGSSTPESDHHDLVAAPINATADHVPTPKTIDIP